MKIKDMINENIETNKIMLEKIEQIEKINRKIESCLRNNNNNNKVLIAGNGGSAADAQHFAAELVGRYKLDRKGLAAIALTTDSSILTAWSNDYGFKTVFSRQIDALGNKGDVFIGLSTSGNSENIIEAVKKAKEKGIYTIAFLGKDGGKIKDIADLAIIVPSDNTPRIQECHIMMIHIICEIIEKNIFGDNE